MTVWRDFARARPRDEVGVAEHVLRYVVAFIAASALGTWVAWLVIFAERARLFYEALGMR